MTLADLLDVLPSGHVWTFTVSQYDGDVGNVVRYQIERDGHVLLYGEKLSGSLAEGLAAGIKATIHRGLQ